MRKTTESMVAHFACRMTLAEKRAIERACAILHCSKSAFVMAAVNHLLSYDTMAAARIVDQQAPDTQP